MKRKTLGLIHTSATLVPVFAQLCKDKLPGVDTFNIADDSLIKEVIRHGALLPATARRVGQHVALAERVCRCCVWISRWPTEPCKWAGGSA